MPVKKVSEMTVGELEKKYGVKTQNGTIKVVGSKYFFATGTKEYELNPKTTVVSQPLDKIATNGMAAGGIIIDGQPVIIIVRPPGGHKPICYYILCYIPVDHRIRIIDVAMREQLVKTLIKEYRIPIGLGRQILADMRSTNIR